MKLLTDHTLEDHANSLADYLPNDKLFSGKKLPWTVLRSFIEGCAYLTLNAEERLNQVSDQYDIRTTTDYISEWERFVGIPDDCFDVDVPLQERREQVLTKLVSLNVQTEQDFIELAAAFGLTITVDSTVPFNPVFRGAGIVINVPPYSVPFIPSSAESPIVCWIRKLVDALSIATFSNT